jgi:DNA-binding transcriptional ArsR family regulator
LRSGNDDRATLGELFDVLASKRRRCLLYELSDRADEPVAFEELVDHLREFERELEGMEATPSSQLAVALHHTHLPKLTGCGLVDYDERTGTVRYHGHRLLDRWLRQTREIDGI